jgi:hypothetical protein
MRYTAYLHAVLILCVAIFFSSCQKEVSFDTPPGNPGSGNGGGNGGGNNNNSIIGDWDFVGLTANTHATIKFTEAGEETKSVTVSSYISKNNVGTVKITATEIITNGIAYSIDTTVNVKTYTDNVLIDDMDMPFIFSVPASSTTSTYTRNNNDSLTVTTWTAGPSTPSGPVQTGPTGMRISWAGDTLVLTVNSVTSQTIIEQGIPVSYVGIAHGITKLKRR